MSRARIRSIKPEFWRDQVVQRLPRDARLLFIGLWSNADDEGRLEGDRNLLRSMVFPCDADVTPRKLEAWLNALADAGRIRLYTVGSMPFVDIPRFVEHQKIDRPTPSTHPAYESRDADDESANDRRTLGEVSTINRAPRARPRIGSDRIGEDALTTTVAEPPPRTPAREDGGDEDEHLPIDYVDLAPLPHLHALGLTNDQRIEAYTAHLAAPEGTRLVALDAAQNGKQPAGLFLSKIRAGAHITAQPAPRRNGQVDAAVRTIRATQRSAGDEEARNELARLDDHLRPLVAADLGWTAA